MKKNQSEKNQKCPFCKGNYWYTE